MNKMFGFTVGDYVVANRAMYDDFDGETFVIYGFSVNLIGEILVLVRTLSGDATTSFYQYELSFEDGSRP